MSLFRDELARFNAIRAQKLQTPQPLRWETRTQIAERAEIEAAAAQQERPEHIPTR